MPPALAPKAPRPPAAPSGAVPPRPASPPRPAAGAAQPAEKPLSIPPAALVTADTDIINAGSGSSETRVGNLAAIQAVPTVGDRIGKYVVERLIGSGGMGLVVAARHEALGELVAIKLLRPKAAGDKVHAERFAREARAIIKIKSEHVVRVLDAGTLESGAPYIVMEYLVGRDLAAILRERGPMPPAIAADHLLQVCEAVASAHAVGVVHRDLKPSNFFVTERADGTTLVKVLDFGISKAIGQEGVVDPNLTETQAVFGSPTYMSPEQIRSAKHVDHRSDIWSLGVALFELLTRKLPFAADNVAGLLASIIADPPFFPRGFAPTLPQELEELVLACLHKDPKQRVQSVVELACRLAPFATQNVETHNLVERIQRLATRSGQASGAHAVMPADSHGASTTTGPKLPQASHPHIAPPPGLAAPPGLAPSPVRASSPGLGPSALGPASPLGWAPSGVYDPRASASSFGSTGMDLSAEARPPVARQNMFTGVVIGLAVATLLILGGVGAWLGTRQTPATSSPPPEAQAPAIASLVPAAPVPTTTTTAAADEPAPTASSAEAAPVAPASTKPASSAGRKTPKHPKPAASSGAAGKAVDPTNDRF